MQKIMNLKNSIKDNELPFWKSIIIWLCRILTGGLFVFSGLAKAVDPWGTLYKMEDYVGAMNISWLGSELLITGAFILFSLEFLIGVFLLTGSFRRITPILTLLFMVVMLPLTAWIAIKNPVPDCGCFGDALHISNWATFFKNVGITIMGIWLLIYNRKAHWLITPALQWIAFVITGIYAVGIGVVGYRVQPLIDFRPYKIGEQLVTSDDESSATHYTFIYEKGGVRKEIGEDDELPNEAEGWSYVERKELPGKKTVTLYNGKSLRLWSPEDEEDVTNEVINKDHQNQLILMIPSLSDVSIASTWKINALQEWASQHNTDFLAIVAGTPKQIEEWKDVSMADYPIYTSEDTSIKEVVRGNPGVIYLSDGKIKWKSSLQALRGDDFMQSSDAVSAESLYLDLTSEAEDVTIFYLSIMAVLVMLSFTPKMFGSRSFFSKSNNQPVTDDDKAHHEELSSPDRPVQ